MAVLEILTYPNKKLRKVAEKVEKIDDSIISIIDDMIETLNQDSTRIGLAAPQIGISKQIIVYDYEKKEDNSSLQALINPVIKVKYGELVSGQEGCLSFPDYTANVKRYPKVEIEALDKLGNPIAFIAEGFFSCVMQHETDHLNGTLIIDHISSLKRELYKRKIKKQKKQHDE